MNAKGYSTADEQTRGAFWMRWAVVCSRSFLTLTASGTQARTTGLLARNNFRLALTRPVR
jgi:hypothetical protein